MAQRIKRRTDVNPERGEHEYGDVTFADPVNNKYPIDSAEHVRAAWSYINHADNAAKYSKDEVKLIKGRIKRAAKTHDVDISEDEQADGRGRALRYRTAGASARSRQRRTLQANAQAVSRTYNAQRP